MSTVLLPLRSNAGWFTSEQTRCELERRLKVCLLLYDEILFQDARYHRFVTSTGSVEMMVPPDKIPEDRRSLEYYGSGPISFSVEHEGRWLPILEGQCVASYAVDFYPILSTVGLLGAEFIKGACVDTPRPLLEKARQEIAEDKENAEHIEGLEGNHFQKASVIDGFYRDSLLAAHCGLPMLVYPNVLAMVKHKNRQRLRAMGVDVRLIAFNCFMRIGMPDWSSSGWDKVISLRESEAGKEFRRRLDQIKRRVEQSGAAIASEEDLQALAADEISRELIRELRARMPRGRELAVDLAVGLGPSLLGIPYVGELAGGVKTIAKFIKERNSWVSLILPR